MAPERLLYAGGRRATYEFVDGAWPDKIIAPAVGKKFGAKILGPDFAGRFESTKITGISAPPNLGWAQLNTDHKKIIAASYPLMDPSDEPPYPEQGVGYLLKSVTEIEGPGEGRLLFNVKVGPDGRARSVTSYESPNQRVTVLVTKILMGAQYTPGKCAGTPCTMMYKFFMEFVEKTSDFRF